MDEVQTGDTVTYKEKFYVVLCVRPDGVLCVALREIALWDNRDCELEGYLLPADKIRKVESE